MNRVLIAPWGKTSGWSETTYVFNGKEKQSICSVALLQESLNPSKTIIILLDTLAHSPIPSYTMLQEQIKERQSALLYEELGEEIEILVAPGIGKFDGVVVNGRMRDFYAFCLYELAKRLPLNEKLTVCLDITHGMNFMPVLLYRVIRELVGITAMGRDTEIRVYNSEPFQSSQEQLNIHVVERGEKRPTPASIPFTKQSLLEVVSSPYLPEDKISKPLRKEKHQNIAAPRPNEKEITSFVSAVANGFPLLLKTVKPKATYLRTYCDQHVKWWSQLTDVSLRDEMLLLNRQMFFTKNFIALVKAYMTTRVIEALDISQGKEVALACLNQIKSKLFKKFQGLDLQITREIERLERKGAKEISRRGTYTAAPDPKILKRWKPLTEYFPGENFTVRNFIAHAGIERNVTEVRCFGRNQATISKNLKVRYINTKKARQKIHNAAEKALILKRQ